MVDEASRTSEDAWHAIRSTLTATRGPIRTIGNVKGRRNWFYRLARQAKPIADPPTCTTRRSPLTTPFCWCSRRPGNRRCEQTLPEKIFRELYYAEPGDDTGNPFGLDHIRACTVGGLALGPVVAWGIDLAKSQDYFVCIGLNEHGEVCEFHRWRGIPWRQSIRRVWQLVGEDTPALVDSTGVGDPVLEELQFEHGNFIGFHFSPRRSRSSWKGLPSLSRAEK